MSDVLGRAGQGMAQVGEDGDGSKGFTAAWRGGGDPKSASDLRSLSPEDALSKGETPSPLLHGK